MIRIRTLKRRPRVPLKDEEEKEQKKKQVAKVSRLCAKQRCWKNQENKNMRLKIKKSKKNESLAEDEEEKTCSDSNLHKSESESMLNSTISYSTLRRENSSVGENLDEITQEFLEMELESTLEENPMVDVILNNIFNILNKCLASTNKALFNAALMQIKSASNMYGKSLNKHIPKICTLVNKKHVLYKAQIKELCGTLMTNGGEGVSKFIATAYPHFCE
ncbi:unnamed protein product [Moneuplotes crassus]|uniref:Uncharacterized protein n=1 Tax=Euplotes crassus TaxID=5936 RepID=A0AAD2D302_EUPCR|nr:unnamed protein product [Moneuplotes crassus]